MTLQEIIDAAVSSDSSVDEILRRCKVVAAQLGNEPLEKWLLWESNGYPQEAELPGYRVWPLLVKGNFMNLAYRVTAWTIPPGAMPNELGNGNPMHRSNDSVSAIEYMLASTESAMISIDLGNLALLLGDNVILGMNCTAAWGEFHRARYAEVLNSVRNRVLDFALALSKEVPEAHEGHDQSIDLPEGRVTQIINTTVLSGSANVVGLSRDSRFTFGIQVGSFDDLAKVLEAQGIGKEDLTALKSALEADPTPPGRNALGPRVSKWIGGMLSKAAEGAWKIALPAASTLLAQAIWGYYLGP